ncbi:MAG TPA: 50S ribosomal protein L23 [Bacilli bacterium]|nr:50S ribosomal protein L23 [Bacilli bacterium]
MARKAAKKEVAVKRATIEQLSLLIAPVITEKSMLLMQEENKLTFKVRKTANKEAIKDAIEAVYNVEVTAVKTINVLSKAKKRGGKYAGTVPGFKKAIVTIKEGQAIDLFKE